MLLGLACAALSACGAAATATEGGGRPKVKPPVRNAKLRAEERAIHEQVLAALHAPPPPEKPGIPSFIPKGTRINRVVTANAAHPALSIEGESVWLDVRGGRTLATLVGPMIPYKLQGTAVPQTPVAFELKLTHTTGTVPLALAYFKITDELGQIITPVIRASSGGPMRASAPVGKTLTLYLRTVLPVGAGSVDYNPGFLRAGARPLVAWDFDVETD